MESIYAERKELVIAGLGPAGLATIIGSKQVDADSQMTVIDATTVPGSGGFNGIAITANSAGCDFIDPLLAVAEFCWVSELPEATSLLDNQSPVPLPIVSSFLGKVASRIVADGGVQHISDHVVAIRQKDDGYVLQISDGDTVETEQVMVAAGATEKILPELSGKDKCQLFKSLEILREERREALAVALEINNQLVIVGGSHSAYSVAEKVLETFPNAQITFAKRRPSRPFFDSLVAATDSGYELSSIDSICPETGRINRFGGLRGAARSLWLREQTGEEKRLTSEFGIDLASLAPDQTIIQASGYVPRMLPLQAPDGQPLDYVLQEAPTGLAHFIVSGQCQPLPNVHGIGLGYGSTLEGFNVYCSQAVDHFSTIKI